MSELFGELSVIGMRGCEEFTKQVDRYLAMLDHYYSFIAEFPESKHSKEMERMAKDARNFLDKNRSTETTL